MKPGVLGPTTKELYDQEADLGHIAEKIKDMGKRERHELENRLVVLLTHLLKWQIQTERRSGSWKATIEAQRSRLQSLLEEMPSLRNALAETLPQVYRRAVVKAVGETGLPANMFPPTCPFDLDQVLDTDFLPA